MTDSIFGSIWNLLSEYKFVYESNENLNCFLCSGLMRDACQSQCGCQFCYKCMVDYIGTGDKFCPGDKEYCGDSHLSFEKNIFRNAMLNKKISMLKVNCPNKSCGSNIRLIEMNDHLRLCKNQEVTCPYFILGCNTEPQNKDAVVSHLHNDSLTHTQLLIELIQNMKNEINVLKLGLDYSKLEVVMLKKELLELRKEMEVRIKEEKIKAVKDEQTMEIEKLTATLEDIRREMGDKCRNSESEICSINNELRQIRRQSGMKEKKDSDNVIAMINGMKDDLNKLREERDLSSKYKDRTMLRWSKMCANFDADFIWRIDGCSTKINEGIFSDSFYSNDYKLYLSVCIGSNDSVGLFCTVMSGANDDKVVWPMKRWVTLSIIDQQTLRPHKTQTYKYNTYECKEAFNRLTNDMNIFGIGSQSFVKYSCIKDKESVVVDDSIIVSCVISDP